MKSLYTLPLRRRLSMLLALCAGATALCGFVAVVTAGLWFQQSRVRSASFEIARTVAYAVQAPLAFDDRKALADALAVLRARSEVRGAWAYDSADRLVASYGRLGSGPPPGGSGGLWQGYLLVEEPVFAGSDKLGRVAICNGLDDVYQTLALEIAAILAGSALGLAVALRLARRVARRITDPITALADTSGAVTRSGDYSKRLPGAGDDEIGHAVRAFNKMLDEVQQRDAALAESNRLLEQRVAARTRELQLEKERAEAASRAKTRFLANMSHELRTPLNAVIGAAQLMQHSGIDPAQSHLVEAIRGSGSNLLGLIENVLDVARIESGALELSLEDFNLVDCIEAALATSSVAARAKGLAVAGIVDPALETWRSGDVLRLRQVLLNLLGNAVKFTRHGEVVLRVAPGGAPDCVRFSVSDTGAGIDLANGRDIFEPFRQGDDTTTRRFGGTGLGLSISRQLVRAMGGDITVESALDRGALFEFEITLAGAVAPGRNPAPLGHRVVLFEPHEPSAQALAQLLQRTGCEARRVHSGAELRERLREFGADAGRRPAPWVLVATDNEAAWPVLEAACAWVDPERLVAMNKSESHAADMARERFNIPRSMIKPVVRSALVSRLCAPPVRAPAVLAASAIDPDKSRLVLVVEDDAMNQMIVCSMLQHAGYRALTANDGGHALDMLRHHAFDIVLMDWQMPDMDGLEVTRRLRAGAVGRRGRRVPIVALTANAFAEDRIACLAAGMNDFLTKPVLSAQLVAAVERWTLRPNASEFDAGTQPAEL